MQVIQLIKTYWTKKSRPAEKAALRNSVPETFEISPSFDGDSFLQTVEYDERNEFRVPKVTTLQFQPDKHGNYFGAIRTRCEGSDLIAAYCYRNTSVGAPNRSPVHRNVLKLAEGEWGRIVHTGRFVGSYSGYGDWYYLKAVFNIANTPDIHSKYFRSSEPKKIFSDIANLR